MANDSDCDPLVLHTMRCIGFTNEQRIAAAAGLEASVTSDSLARLEARGFASHTSGVFGGWGVTDAGRTGDAAWVEAELAATGARSEVTRAYDEFRPLNSALLQVCHDWQLRKVGGQHIANDHDDVGYDLAVIDRLVGIDGAIGPILVRLSERLARFATYRNRLSAALARVEAGRHVFITDDIDSYHTVWFQLHEDLLATLGIPRGSER